MIELTREISSLEGTSPRYGVYKLDSQTASKSAHRILSSTLIADNGGKKSASYEESREAVPTGDPVGH